MLLDDDDELMINGFHDGVDGGYIWARKSIFFNKGLL
jgi:hypothetical protein